MKADSPRPPLDASPAVLVLLTGSLGDIVRALPLVSLLKHQRPRARVSWLVDARWRGLLDGHPAVDRLITFPRERTLRALRSLVDGLRAERPDLALDLQRSLKSGICGRVSGAARRVGFHPADSREFNHLFDTEHVARWKPGESKLRHYLAFAEHLGLALPDTPEFGLRRVGEPRLRPEAIRTLTGGFVCVVMGSSWPSKDWTEEGYRNLVATIRRESPLSAVLVGDHSQCGLADRVAALGGGDRVVNLVGRTTLPELSAVLAAARAALGPDSGPGHLAAAMGTPHVTLLGPTSAGIVVPHGCEHLVVRSPVECEPCARRRCHRRAGRCMDAITAEMAWAVLAPLVWRDPPAADAS